MTEGTWKDAHNETDLHISRMAGFAAILRHLAADWEPFNNGDPLAQGMLWMICTMADDMRGLADLHSEEWRLKLRDERKDMAADA